MSEILLATLLLTAIVLALTFFVIGARRLLMPAHAVTITVNDKLAISGKAGDKLLSILTGADIPIPSACAGAGTCGLCRVRITEGGGEPLPTELARIDRKDIREGMHLSCQVVVRNDMKIVVPEEILSAESFEGEVVSNRMLAPLIKELKVKLPDDIDFNFVAGGFAQLTALPYEIDFSATEVAPRHEPAWQQYGWRGLKAKHSTSIARAYSIANTPEDQGFAVFNIRLAVPPPNSTVPPGVVSSYLFNLRAGDKLTMAGPFGEFRVQDTSREMIFIGGGVGMAPLKAMIYEQLEKVGTTRKMSYWYGARSLTDLFYKERFDKLAAEHDNFTWTVGLSDPAPEDNWTGATGFIHEVIYQNYLKAHPAPEECEYYLCGPPLMIAAVLAMLDELGVESDMIYYDNFGS